DIETCTFTAAPYAFAQAGAHRRNTPYAGVEVPVVVIEVDPSVVGRPKGEAGVLPTRRVGCGERDPSTAPAPTRPNSPDLIFEAALRVLAELFPEFLEADAQDVFERAIDTKGQEPAPENVAQLSELVVTVLRRDVVHDVQPKQVH